MCGQIGQNEPRPPVSNAICAVPAGRRSTAPFASLSLKNKSIFGPPMASSCALPRTGVLRHDGFRRYWIARFLGSFSAQIMGMSAGWQIYDITHDPSALGMVGLTLFLPVFLLVLLTGAIADKFNRVRIMTTCIVGEGLCALAFLTFTIIGAQSAVLIFCTLVVLGTLRAFFGPAQQSLMPSLVPEEELPSAIAWGTSSWQIATVFGPVAGGLLHSVSSEMAYIIALVLLTTAAVMAVRMSTPSNMGTEKPSLRAMIAGFCYIWREKVVLGAISLDLSLCCLVAPRLYFPSTRETYLWSARGGLAFCALLPPLARSWRPPS